MGFKGPFDLSRRYEILCGEVMTTVEILRLPFLRLLSNANEKETSEILARSILLSIAEIHLWSNSDICIIPISICYNPTSGSNYYSVERNGRFSSGLANNK